MKKYLILLYLIFSFLFGFTQIISYDWLRTMGNENDDHPKCIYSNSNGGIKLVIESPAAGNSDTIFLIDTFFIGSNNCLFNFNEYGNINSIIKVPDILTSSISGFQESSSFMYSIMSRSTWGSYNYGSSTTPITQTRDVFVTKQDTLGNPISLKVILGSGDDYASNIVIDNNGNVIITGYYDSPTLSFAGTTIGNSGSEDAFIAKYDSLGNELWIKRIFSSANNEPTDLVVDAFGDIYYIQRYNVTPLNVGGSTLPANNSYVTYLLKFDTNGNLLWNVPFGGDLASNLYDLEVDSSNYILLCGRSKCTTFFINNDTIWSSASGTGFYNDNSFLVKLSPNGNLLWTKYTNNAGHLDGNREPAIACDKDDNAYLTFHIYNNDTLYFDSDTINTAIDNPLEAPYFCKFSTTGEKQWIMPLETSHGVKPNKIVVDDEYNIFIAGRFFGNPDVQFDSLSSPSFFPGSLDVFLLKATQYIPDHTKHFINLNQGWSIISSYVDPYVPDCDTVFVDVASDMVLMKNDVGQTFWPVYNVNTIGDFLLGEGYIIKMNTFNILEISGIAAFPQWSPLALNQDWSIIGYLRQNSGAIGSMLAGITSNLYVVKNGSGLVYWPMYGINNIGNMNPGEGYQIKMLAADTLLYPAN
ncbi:MAG: hypothetical protein HN704_07560 [Bacteroidetes bacterium]|nr:hypothetical protein [Bacteroidota bacterium]MBT6685300.1 hypothetical protein [Bacteroidota bacterium]MBT7141747.1 hypothetical protein [Bacteroidota bacterium]MBT7491445.1 hypothetical protein [Bacteroidota bacterium]